MILLYIGMCTRACQMKNWFGMRFMVGFSNENHNCPFLTRFILGISCFVDRVKLITPILQMLSVVDNN